MLLTSSCQSRETRAHARSNDENVTGPSPGRHDRWSGSRSGADFVLLDGNGIGRTRSGADFVHLDGNGIGRTPRGADFGHLDDNRARRCDDVGNP